jgi:hypothetical protein
MKGSADTPHTTIICASNIVATILRSIKTQPSLSFRLLSVSRYVPSHTIITLWRAVF